MFLNVDSKVICLVKRVTAIRAFSSRRLCLATASENFLATYTLFIVQYYIAFYYGKCRKSPIVGLRSSFAVCSNFTLEQGLLGLEVIRK